MYVSRIESLYPSLLGTRREHKEVTSLAGNAKEWRVLHTSEMA